MARGQIETLKAQVRLAQACGSPTAPTANATPLCATTCLGCCGQALCQSRQRDAAASSPPPELRELRGELEESRRLLDAEKVRPHAHMASWEGLVMSLMAS